MTDRKLEVTINQGSGFNSDASQQQVVNIGNHYAVDKVYEKLVAIHQSPITFDPTSLRDIIISIDAGISTVDATPIDFTTSIDINLKNDLNNHSKDYFEDFVELDFYPQFYKLDRFFELKENQQTIQPKVDNLIKCLNRQIVAFQGTEKFEAILLKISSKLIDSNYAHLQKKKPKLLFLFIRTYFRRSSGKSGNHP